MRFVGLRIVFRVVFRVVLNIVGDGFQQRELLEW